VGPNDLAVAAFARHPAGPRRVRDDGDAVDAYRAFRRWAQAVAGALNYQGAKTGWRAGTRNIDHALPASYTIEMIFNLPVDFPGGGVASVPGVLMKRSAQEPGTPLAKVAARATNGVFIIELSAAGTDEQRNVQMLKESPWFDIPIGYINGSRAILATEKGLPGYRAFAKAFAVWEKK
jgi:hypothetical protein